MIEIKISGNDFAELRVKANEIFGLLPTISMVSKTGYEIPPLPAGQVETEKRKPGRQPGFSPKKNGTNGGQSQVNGSDTNAGMSSHPSGIVNGVGGHPSNGAMAISGTGGLGSPTNPFAMHNQQPSPPAPPNTGGQVWGATPSTPPHVAVEVTIEQAKAAVEKVLNAKGVNFAHQCIKHFGGERIRDLDKSKWPALIQHCEAQL